MTALRQSDGARHAAAHWYGELVSRRERMARPFSTAAAVIAPTTADSPGHQTAGCGSTPLTSNCCLWK